MKPYALYRCNHLILGLLVVQKWPKMEEIYPLMVCDEARIVTNDLLKICGAETKIFWDN